MTIKEIAKLANVSLGTVDRVIHKRGKVSKETEKKILDIIKKVNYTPNIYARGLALNKQYRIYALVPQFSEGQYWEMPVKGMQSAAINLSQFGIQLEVLYFDQNSATSFNTIAEQLLSQEPDGVILAPVINFEAVKLSKKLKEAKVPYVLIDSKIQNSQPLSFIGQDAFQSGRLAARLLCAEINSKGSISIISIKNNENYNNTLQQRIEGFKDYIANSDFIDQISLNESHIHVSTANIEQAILNAINPENNTAGVFVPSSMIHRVAACVDQNSSEFSQLKMIGNDLIHNNIKYLEKGTISYLIGQRPENQGYYALSSFYKHLVLGQEVAEDMYLPLDIITQENLKYYNNNFQYNF
ncbi:substrate-binding domain-containing protein [Galbibacter sp.]|uniref:substrate-binding domain-containing protein n=1 Tax=Galbibacter sp. TaxID=2918471 RepID=UPI003A8E4FDA